MFITQTILVVHTEAQKALYHSSPDLDQEVRVRITIGYIYKQVCGERRNLLLEELSDSCCPP